MACTSLVVSQLLHRLAPYSYAAPSGHIVAARSLLSRPRASTVSGCTAPSPTARIAAVYTWSSSCRRVFLTYFEHHRRASQGNLQGALSPSQVLLTTPSPLQASNMTTLGRRCFRRLLRLCPLQLRRQRYCLIPDYTTCYSTPTTADSAGISPFAALRVATALEASSASLSDMATCS